MQLHIFLSIHHINWMLCFVVLYFTCMQEPPAWCDAQAHEGAGR